VGSDTLPWRAPPGGVIEPVAPTPSVRSGPKKRPAVRQARLGTSGETGTASRRCVRPPDYLIGFSDR